MCYGLLAQKAPTRRSGDSQRTSAARLRTEPPMPCPARRCTRPDCWPPAAEGITCPVIARGRLHRLPSPHALLHPWLPITCASAGRAGPLRTGAGPSAGPEPHARAGACAATSSTRPCRTSHLSRVLPDQYTSLCFGVSMSACRPADRGLRSCAGETNDHGQMAPGLELSAFRLRLVVFRLACAAGTLVTGRD
jgi:hypothetical protein